MNTYIATFISTTDDGYVRQVHFNAANYFVATTWAAVYCRTHFVNMMLHTVELVAIGHTCI